MMTHLFQTQLNKKFTDLTTKEDLIMKIKNLTIKAHYMGGELAYFTFHRDYKDNHFATLDGGYCTHSKFINYRDLYKAKQYKQLVDLIASEYNKTPYNFNIIEGDTLKDNWKEIYTTQPVFTFEELT